jgi:hypothetical protein
MMHSLAMEVANKKRPPGRGRPVGVLTYSTPRYEVSPHGHKLKIGVAPELMEQSGLKSGDKVDIRIDTQSGIGLLARNAQYGWSLRQINSRCRCHYIRPAWRPESGFPLTDQDYVELHVYNISEGEITFQLPTPKRTPNN